MGRNKIYLLDLFEWIQSAQRGCHRSLAVARRRKMCVETHCSSSVQPKMLGEKKRERKREKNLVPRCQK